ncbi:cilia- and flagella-associated protein 221 [Silurus meridionalis]|uniref:Cep192-like domain-containing protein n=1 Tax=Silurus meridionalis TaxID=175797 RepID=A0A8T0AC34_SILME|nr:cilia- and flagella-associated protein 221 [Silurus meridionalis]KAF7689707.1 hypothetical protein HF521_013060 [Silurus meridionalis]
MEVVLQTPNSEKKKTILPLGQLVEETRRTPKVSHHLLETKIFAKVKSNNIIEVEPSELHFSGFEVGKEYRKAVKIINISTKVIRIHVIPPETKYFRTEHTPMSRLVPGLAHTITVHFRPNEWRYFFDSIRIHCKGEENLLVNVHAYPVIDDLNIPPQIDLSPVPLGQSSTYALPLRCSSPVDFEFQVYYLSSHEAFSIQPLSGVIPAHGKTDLLVTFKPKQYGMAEITLHLVIAQFNSKPFLCTFTASCPPNLTPNQQTEKDEVACLKPKVACWKPKAKRKQRIQKKKTPGPITPSSDLDLTSHGNLAKMLIQSQDKISYKDLGEATTHTNTADQTRQIKEAAFESQVQENVQKDSIHLLGQVQLGDDLFSEEQKIKILQEQEVAASEYMMNKDMGGEEMDIDQTCRKLSSHRVVHCAEEHPDSTPEFSVYESNQLESRSRVLRLFQQTVRKVILQVRINKRLLLLRELVSTMKKQSGDEENIEEEEQLLDASPEKLLPYMSPVFPSTNQPEETAITKLNVPVEQTEEDLTSTIPLFNLKVPQHYKQMHYQKVAVIDSESSFVPIKQLRKGDQEKELQEQERSKPDVNPILFFRTPHNVLNPQNAHPLRIFNPAPNVHAFRPTPLYLECDPEFHLCPLTRNTICTDQNIKSTQKLFLHREEIIKGTLIWKQFSCLALNAVSSVPALTSSQSPRMSDPFCSLVLPLEAPPPLKDLPDNIREEITETEGAGANLNPSMVQDKLMAYEYSPPTAI